MVYLYSVNKMCDEIKSKCCDAHITIGDCASKCDECGNSVNPDSGLPYPAKTWQFGGI